MLSEAKSRHCGDKMMQW